MNVGLDICDCCDTEQPDTQVYVFEADGDDFVWCARCVAELTEIDRIRRGGLTLECVACGRTLTNDLDAPNVAHWTPNAPRRPYCGDSAACQRDAELSGDDPTYREWTP